MSKKILRYIDLFAGAGGLSLGLYQAGLKGVFAIEKNADAFSSLKHNLIENRNHFEWPEWLPIKNHDICEFVKQYKSNLLNLSGKIDLVVGGPPCQGFSLAGKRDHTDTRNTMVHYYLDIIELIKPKYLILENVHGFTLEFKADVTKKPYSQLVIERLKKLGYYISTKEIRMNEYGIPQKRLRFILVGSLKDNVSDFFIKLKQNRISYLKSKGIEEKITVKDAIGDLLQSYGSVHCPDSNRNFLSGKYGPINSKYQNIMRQGIFGESPDSHRFAKHSKEIIKMQQEIIDKIKPGLRITPKDNLIDGLKRRGTTLLNPYDQSPTVTTHPDDFIHYCEPRILTVREMARLQTFPDWYEFLGKYTTGGKLRKVDVPRYTQVGNAVPPMFAEQLGIILRRLK